ncbi:hypothetical protein CEE37_08740 [candidate division LCP-89 bacterium B3_LCP]|uniref:Uncharacterized protein n=1 Tax=candidate division LCP-89 bacterium B3_LCP TaxID=2012998 RepID=A0A532UZQ4_UNCL8|nr:MAG: hypothetical protein CEE37_08740 [candidate division LCP-89 bacterium B3_LCP]
MGTEKSSKKKGFVFKPFVQGPDSVIHPQDDQKTSPWPERWGRRCGNPLYEKKPVKANEE